MDSPCIKQTVCKVLKIFQYGKYLVAYVLNIYKFVHTECMRPSGGASVFVKSSSPQRKIDLQTELQATAVSATLYKEITICSVYIPPSFSLNSQHLDSLLQQLPSPYIILGDFNGHNILWGNKNNDSRGKLIENFLTKNDIMYYE